MGAAVREVMSLRGSGRSWFRGGAGGPALPRKTVAHGRDGPPGRPSIILQLGKGDGAGLQAPGLFDEASPAMLPRIAVSAWMFCIR